MLAQEVQHRGANVDVGVMVRAVDPELQVTLLVMVLESAAVPLRSVRQIRALVCRLTLRGEADGQGCGWSRQIVGATSDRLWSEA